MKSGKFESNWRERNFHARPFRITDWFTLIIRTWLEKYGTEENKMNTYNKSEWNGRDTPPFHPPYPSPSNYVLILTKRTRNQPRISKKDIVKTPDRVLPKFSNSREEKKYPSLRPDAKAFLDENENDDTKKTVKDEWIYMCIPCNLVLPSKKKGKWNRSERTGRDV